jgi:hypothetical protein
VSPRLVKVVWMDAQMLFGVDKGEMAPLLRVETVGWLTHEGPGHVNVAQEDSGGEWRGVTAIPRSCILDIVPVRGTRPVRGARPESQPHRDGDE